MTTRTKRICKALTWRVAATTITMIVAYILLGSIESALHIGVLDTIIKLVAYYYHEKIWDRVRPPEILLSKFYTETSEELRLAHGMDQEDEVIKQID